MDKCRLFSTSMKCPVCGEAFSMRINDSEESPFYCEKCSKTFTADEVFETVNEVFVNGINVSMNEITFHSNREWLDSKAATINYLSKKFNIEFITWSDFGNDNILIHFSWRNHLSGKLITEFTDEILNAC